MIRHGRDTNRMPSLVILLGAAVLLAVGGCGEKGPPRPPPDIALLPVTDLKHSIRGNRVILTWSLPRDAIVAPEPPVAFKILGARLSRKQSDCSSCPLPFEPLGEVAVQPENRSAPADHPLTFQWELQPGNRYVFKVIGLSRDRDEGPESNAVDFNFD